MTSSCNDCLQAGPRITYNTTSQDTTLPQAIHEDYTIKNSEAVGYLCGHCGKGDDNSGKEEGTHGKVIRQEEFCHGCHRAAWNMCYTEIDRQHTLLHQEHRCTCSQLMTTTEKLSAAESAEREYENEVVVPGYTAEDTNTRQISMYECTKTIWKAGFEITAQSMQFLWNCVEKDVISKKILSDAAVNALPSQESAPIRTQPGPSMSSSRGRAARNLPPQRASRDGRDNTTASSSRRHPQTAQGRSHAERGSRGGRQTSRHTHNNTSHASYHHAVGFEQSNSAVTQNPANYITIRLEVSELAQMAIRNGSAQLIAVTPSSLEGRVTDQVHGSFPDNGQNRAATVVDGAVVPGQYCPVVNGTGDMAFDEADAVDDRLISPNFQMPK